MRTRALAILTTALLAVAGAGALAGSAGGAASASSPAACKDATLLPAASNLARIKVATRCVINALRSQGHRRKLG